MPVCKTACLKQPVSKATTDFEVLSKFVEYVAVLIVGIETMCPECVSSEAGKNNK